MGEDGAPGGVPGAHEREPANDAASERRGRWFIWVPEFRVRGSTDKWAHRKGEPRAFALLWCLYLFFCSAVTLFGVEQSDPPSGDQYEFPARVLLTLMLFGVAVLWPCVRLCQATPRNRAGASLADALVVLIPAQALVWPMVLLLSWPVELVGFVAALVASWGFVSMGVSAWGAGGVGTQRRVLAMSVSVGGALAGGLGGVVWSVLSGTEVPRWAWAWCPLTAVWVASEPGGPLAPLTVERLMWAGALVPGALGLGLWLVVWISGDGTRTPARPAA